MAVFERIMYWVIFYFFSSSIYTHWEREHTRTFAVVMLCVCLFLARAHSSQFSCFSRRSARLYSIYVVRCMVFCCCVLFLFSIYSCLFSSVFVTKIFLTHTYTILRPNTRCTVDVFSCFLFFLLLCCWLCCLLFLVSLWKKLFLLTLTFWYHRTIFSPRNTTNYLIFLLGKFLTKEKTVLSFNRLCFNLCTTNFLLFCKVVI